MKQDVCKEDWSGIERALEASVVLRRSDLPPCQWSQPQPCENIFFARAPGGLDLCFPHYERWMREL